MASMSRRTSLTLLGTFPLAGAAVAHGQHSAPPVPATAAREKIRARYFPNVTVITHEGRKVRFYDDLIRDKIVTINFMYADCEGICPGITANLAKVQKALGDRVGRDIFMYSLTLKPEHDTPEVLKEYADMHGVKPGWSLLTGDPADMELLRRKLGFVDPDPEIDKDKNEHIGNVRYGNEALQLWASCPGLASPKAIVSSIGFVDWPVTKPGRR
jgi:protein SCO1/2